MSTLPWWQVNIPPALREATCPNYLADLAEKDQRIIGTPDEDYRPLQWRDVKRIIEANELDAFERQPSELRKYRAYIHGLIKHHGSVMNFVLKHRLCWEDTTTAAEPFTNMSDIKILYNDWPYGIDPSIVHLVVWTKFPIEDDETTGDLTPKMRTRINGFVTEQLHGHISAEDVIWFRNWRSLKSVHAVEHFHVMLNKPPEDFVRRLTHGDVPMSSKVDVNGIGRDPTQKDVLDSEDETGV